MGWMLVVLVDLETEVVFVVVVTLIWAARVGTSTEASRIMRICRSHYQHLRGLQNWFD